VYDVASYWLGDVVPGAAENNHTVKVALVVLEPDFSRLNRVINPSPALVFAIVAVIGAQTVPLVRKHTVSLGAYAVVFDARVSKLDGALYKYVPIVPDPLALGMAVMLSARTGDAMTSSTKT
jgi:hypothetical protein